MGLEEYSLSFTPRAILRLQITILQGTKHLEKQQQEGHIIHIHLLKYISCPNSTLFMKTMQKLKVELLDVL